MTFIKWFFTAAIVLTTGLIQPAQAQNWRLVDAKLINDDTHLILTVPSGDQAALNVVADAIADQFGVILMAEWPLNSIAVHCFIFDASSVADLQTLINNMRADTRIRTVQRMRIFEPSEALYTDPLFALQWSLERLNVPKAHLVSTGEGIRIGIIDTAIDATHPDLADQVVDKRDFVTTSGISTAEAHGTAIAGIISADATNAGGIVGVAPNAELIGLRACWQDRGAAGHCNSFSLARALNFAILNDYDILNLSIGGPDDPLVRELVQTAIDTGLIVVAASGETDTTAFPASIDGVIAAGSSLNGSIPAPMADVITTAPSNRHRYVSGSSAAAAHVSGVVALMLSEQQDLTSDQIATTLAAAVTLRDNVPMLDACKSLGGTVEFAAGCAP
jgi:hypothetical protein